MLTVLHKFENSELDIMVENASLNHWTGESCSGEVRGLYSFCSLLRQENSNLNFQKQGVCTPFVVCWDKRIRTWIFKNKRNKEWQAITFVIFKFCNLFHVQCFKTTTGNNQSIPQMYHTKARFMRKSVVHQYSSVINCLPYD